MRKSALSAAPFNKTTIKAIFLDLEGVIIDTIGINRENVAFIYSMIVNGVKDPDKFKPSEKDIARGRKFFNERLGQSTRTNLQELLVSLADTFPFEGSIMEMHDYFITLYTKRRDAEIAAGLSKSTKEVRKKFLFPGVEEFLTSMKSKKVDLYVISAGKSKIKRQILEMLKIDENFEKIIFARSKEDKLDTIFDLMEQNDISSENSIFVDDAPDAVLDMKNRCEKESKELWIVGMPDNELSKTKMQDDKSTSFVISNVSELISEIN